MTDTFHLSHDPWLPCELPDGRLVLRSTREALVQAHELRGLVLDPLESAAVHRHLLAVVHRVVDGPASKEDWVGIWSAGRFDEEAVEGAEAGDPRSRRALARSRPLGRLIVTSAEHSVAS